ncbi:B-cell receptor CD22-like isoform X3 [Archocentrus centrarchus]|uniref:B-cell receptor CD22-like isoform X3 n=1 Tax=Archocentrus centrarchus TaxID=63155 RepID=UPI0011E9D923|nr:B-cell receptor CD22-like isoform X3 [Archocentrus centrarchus]
MLCDLRADEVQEMRAAMSSTAAASGVILFLLSLPVVQGRNGWSVDYTSTQICALKGSTVTIGCSFTFPYSKTGRYTTVNKKVWFIKGNDYDPDDLKRHSAYAGRLTYSNNQNSCNLTIRDLRESDSAVYKFRFETNNGRGSYTGSPGVTLTVTALQVHVGTSSYPNWAVLTCQSSCQLRNRPSFIWYKNGQKIYGQTNMYLYPEIPNPSDSFSCAASGHEALPSPSVCVRGDSCNRVNYSNRNICAFKGSSVDISCTYSSYYQQIQPKSWFRSGRGSEDLRKVSQHEGRVEVTDTERGRSTLRIRDLRESDSAEYHFKFKSQSFEWTSSLPGTTLTVTDVQVQVTGRRLDCVTRCNPYVSSYVWYINGEQVDGASSASYEISYEESSDDENSYSCALKGFEDFHSPLICHKKIQWCNKVTYDKRSICAFKGSSVDISCTYNSYDQQIKSKSWFRSGRGSEDLRKDSQYEGRVEVTETMVGGSTLRIRDLRESDSAEYHFKFKTGSFEWKNSLPGTTLTVAALQVKVSRIISVHQSHTEAELTCFSSCRPDGHLSFVWFKNNKVILEKNPYQDRLNPGDIISCAFKGYENDRSAPVYAPKPPSVSVSPSAEIVEGSSVTLTCSSDANPAANYTWYKEEKLIRRGQQFIFESIQSSDSGEYYCTAENELGKRSSKYISINVKYIPKLVSSFPSVPPKLPSVSVSPSAEIVEGSTVTLTCSSDANPAAKYTWYKEQKLISRDQSLVFDSIQSSDSGEYYCTAEDELGKRSSEYISINVKYIPKLVSASPSVPQKPPSVSVSPSAEIVEGSSVTLTCSSDANPAAKYTWYKEGEDSPKASGEIFTITDIRPEHSGSYYCEAQNTRGRQNSTLQLINIASSRKSAAFASITVVFLAFIILSGIILIRRKRCFKANSSIERPDNTAEGNTNDYYTLSAWPEHHGPSAAAQSTAAEQQDDVCYASVSFFKKQEEPNYYNIIPTQPKRQNEDEEVEDVEYTHIRFSSTQRLRHHQTVEYSSAVYGTVNRK